MLSGSIFEVTVGTLIVALVAVTVTYWPSLITLISTSVPSSPFTRLATSAVSMVRVSLPFTAQMMSPALRPAFSAGVPGIILVKTGAFVSLSSPIYAPMPL